MTDDQKRVEKILEKRAVILSKPPIAVSKITMLELLQDDYFWLISRIKSLEEENEQLKQSIHLALQAGRGIGEFTVEARLRAAEERVEKMREALAEEGKGEG